MRPPARGRAAAGEIRSAIEAVELMRAAGNLCIGGDDSSGDDARPVVELLVAGLRFGS